MNRMEELRLHGMSIWHLVFVMLLLPALSYFAYYVVLPDVMAIFNGEAVVSYSFRRIYLLIFPIVLFFPLEIILIWKFILNKELPKKVNRCFEIMMVYGGVGTLLVAPLGNIAMGFYIESKGYVYCKKESDTVWRQVYALDDTLCVNDTVE